MAKILCDGHCDACGMKQWCDVHYGENPVDRQIGVLQWLKEQRDDAILDMPNARRKLDAYLRAEEIGNADLAKQIAEDLNSGAVNAYWLIALHRTVEHYSGLLWSGKK